MYTKELWGRPLGVCRASGSLHLQVSRTYLKYYLEILGMINENYQVEFRMLFPREF
jgi:hypothetical protein